MSTTVSGPPAVKKISSWVRPGVCEVRASALRLVSALIRLDLPTLERPAKAISMPSIAGSDWNEAAADRKRHSAAKSLRPVSLSSGVNEAVDIDRADHTPSLSGVSLRSQLGPVVGQQRLHLAHQIFRPQPLDVRP